MSNQPSDFQINALELATRQQSHDWLQSLREQGAQRWEQAPWPTRKTELWKYTPLAPLQKGGFAQWADAQSGWESQVDLIEGDFTRMVFVNGVFDPEHSSAELPDGVVRFESAGETDRELIRQNLGSVVNTDRHLFAALSNAWANEGVLIHVPANQALDKPVYIVHVSTPEAEPATASQRTLILLETGAQASVTEHYVSTSDEQNGFVNALTEARVADNASLSHCRVNLEEENLLHVGGVHAELHRNARMNGFTVAQGSRLKRIDYQVDYRGEGGELMLNGVYLPRNRQLVDYHTNIEHAVPHCTTSETFRGIVGDASRAVFNGRIHIHPQAQKSLAELSNKNLLTSKKAEVDTKPELEIYADDVQCAHGATVSQLDSTALYYLQSRGLSRQDAQVMLSFGFINELLQQAPDPAVQAYLRPRLATLLGQADTLGEQWTNEQVSHD